MPLNPFVMLAIVALFFIAISYLTYRGYRQTTSKQDYLLGGRSVHPFVMAMSYGAAFISTSAIVGFGGMAAKFGWGLLWLPFLNIAIGILVAFLCFGRRTRRIGQILNAHTFPEFLGLRFQSQHLKWVVALIIFTFLPLYSSAVLIGGARVLEGFMPYNIALFSFAIFITIYVIFGGIRGVMYVDALMGGIMVCGMVALLLSAYNTLGGVEAAHSQLSDMSRLVPQELVEFGHRGWTRMPEFNSGCWWWLVSSLMLGVGIGALAQPQLAVRFMTVDSTKQLNRAILVGSIFILLTAGIAYVIGGLANVWFYRETGKIAIEAVPGGNADLIIPQFVNGSMPPIFTYVFTLTLISAGMSTLSSLLHVIGSSLGNDLFCGLTKSEHGSIWLNRMGIVFGVVLSVMLGFLLPPSIIARVTAIFFGICAASFLPTYVAALYWKRATRSGVWASIMVGALSTVFGLLFTHLAEAKSFGICKMLFGTEVLFGTHPWPYVDPLVISLPLSAVTLIVVSLMSRAPNTEHLTHCFNLKQQE